MSIKLKGKSYKVDGIKKFEQFLSTFYFLLSTKLGVA